MKRMIRENRKNILLQLLCVLFGAILLFGCSDDAFQQGRTGPVDQSGVPEGFVRARVNMVVSGFDVVQTKSLDHEQEHAWSHVIVGQFDVNNNLLPSSIQRYPYGTSGNFNIILEESNGDENLIYFVTNYGDAGGDLNDAANNPFIDPGTGNLVADLDAFRTRVYTPPAADNAGISDGNKLIMVGAIETVVDQTSTPISSMLVYVDKLTAKLDVQIWASQSIANPSNSFGASYLTITGMKIKNVPKSAALAADGVKISSTTDLDSITTTLVAQGGDLVKGFKTSESYYILENRMHDDNNPLHPNDASEKGQEQFKNHAARDNGIADLATYLLIEGNLNDGRNVGTATWTIYLGENNVDNFNIKRNTHYTITVKIDGAGLATSDVRVNKDNLHVRELRFLNGQSASNRSPETSYPGPEDENWGNLVSPAAVKNNNYLYMDASDETWGFELTGQNGAALTDWPGLSVSYLPLATPGATDPGTTTNMSDNQIRSKWLPDNVEENWVTLPGLSATGLPSGVRVRINTGINLTPSARTVDFRYFNDAIPSEIRVWRLVQSAGEMINVLDYNFIPPKAGKYGVMVRALEDSYWRLQSGGNTNIQFAGSADKDGNLVQTSAGSGYIKGHGTILFDAKEYTGIPYRNIKIVVRTFQGHPDNPAVEYVDKTVNVYQMASTENFVSTKEKTSGRYVYDYSTDPLYETLFAFPLAIPMGINLLDEGTAYHKDESLYKAWSTVDGKDNTLKIFRKLEGYVADQTVAGSMGLAAPPIFSPAGICMMMNKDWQNITSTDDPNFEWYLPARYHGLMGATSVMLGIKGMGHSSRGAFWTSTMPLTKPGTERESGYFAGTTVDVSANYSATSTVRCVRDNKNVTKSYPYLTEDFAGNPVVVSYEVVGGVPKGYTEVQPATSGSQAVYRLGKPLRFTEAGQVTSDQGIGPSDKNWSYLSPKFRVAKQDAVISGSSRSGIWPVASGWSDENAIDIATPATGCAAYVEDGTGWRVPSELEMRQILLLGGGIGSAPGSEAEVPVVQTGGKSFSDFVPSGFNYLGTASGRNYWTNRVYSNDNRVAYFTVSDLWARPIGGSAVAWNSSYYVRCVRDL